MNPRQTKQGELKDLGICEGCGKDLNPQNKAGLCKTCYISGETGIDDRKGRHCLPPTRSVGLDWDGKEDEEVD